MHLKLKNSETPFVEMNHNKTMNTVSYIFFFMSFGSQRSEVNNANLQLSTKHVYSLMQSRAKHLYNLMVSRAKHV